MQSMETENDNHVNTSSTTSSTSSSNNGSTNNLLGNLSLPLGEPHEQILISHDHSNSIHEQSQSNSMMHTEEQLEEPQPQSAVASLMAATNSMISSSSFVPLIVQSQSSTLSNPIPPPPPPLSSQPTAAEAFSPFLYNMATATVNPLDNSSQVNFSLASTSLSSSTNSTSITSPSPQSSSSSSASLPLPSAAHNLEVSSVGQAQQTQSLLSPNQSFIQEHSPSPSFYHQQLISPPTTTTQPYPSSSSAAHGSSAASAAEAENSFNCQNQEAHSSFLIADTIDASAVVEPVAAVSDLPQQQQQTSQSVNLDDNDNNEFEVDLNVAHQQQQHESAPPLDTSASGSGTVNANRIISVVNTSLPLRQQQLTEEPKHPPASSFTTPAYAQTRTNYYQNYQTPPSYTLPGQQPSYHNHHQYHSHPVTQSHYPTHYLPPYGFGIGPYSRNNNSAIMFANTSSTDNANGSLIIQPGNAHSTTVAAASSTNTGGGSSQTVDRIKLLYPNVNEAETPLPRCWSAGEKCVTIALSQNNMRVQYKTPLSGNNKTQQEPASVRTAHPIPSACGIYYFEVKIISKSKNGYMGIGLTAQQFRMNRLPGCDKQSFGYHGAEGNSFASSGHGQSYGPTFTTGDIIGCCVNFVNNTCFYTKNGIDLGIAFRDLPTKLYPTVGLQAPGEEVDVNFGQEPFKFDQIEEMMKQMRAEMSATINDFPLPPDQSDPITLLQKLVSSYLVHNGYSETAEAFSRCTGQTFREEMSSIRNRQKILKLIMSGKMGQAIEHTLRSYPGLLENNKNLWFMLKCRQFIEMINGSDVEYCHSNNKNATITTANNNNNKNNNNNSSSTTIDSTNHNSAQDSNRFSSQQQATTSSSSTCATVAPPQQTSVIQSTKLYQNGGGVGGGNRATGSTNSGSGDQHDITDETSPTQNITDISDIVPITITTTATTTTTSTTVAEIVTANTTITNKCNNSSTTNSSAQNSTFTAVINMDNENSLKIEGNLVGNEAADGLNNITSTQINKCHNDDDYYGDVEMDRNGLAANGDTCKNNDTNNFNESVDNDEAMDVDVAPPRKYTNGIERILEFGKDLSQMGQQLERENKMTDEDRQMLEDAFSLIAYSNPWSSPLGWQLCPTKRETVCTALNSAILESMYYPKRPPLDYCVAHANELLKVMAQASLGACAFVTINDVFPKD